ncbi:hypothetical protein [Hymenobacter sp. BT559]|uniref:hypothetical protein n=1 Tax=Hymenobacter sp. BT559 TaxID=2795729 RepID=UPI0018EAE52E|nr:hypothetical protein [Hymenobacter sp. BT559]MBJ6143497.1 hypothetical protein [Hymenobacter sp. BT559]
MKKLLALATTAVLGLLLAPATHAQDVYMDMFNSANQAAVSMSLVNINNAAVMASTRNASAKRGAAGSTASAASRKVSLAYTPSAALRQQTVQDMSRQMQASNPSAAQALTNAFGPGKSDYGQLFTELVKESGLPANNAATAFAAYLEIGYIVVNNVLDQRSITPAMDRALQRQTAGLLAQNKTLTSPAAIAKFRETTKLQAILLYLGWQNAQKTGKASQFRSTIAEQFRKQGLDLSLVKLTTQGLEKK